MIKDMDIQKIISHTGKKPDILEIFCETDDDVNDWHHKVRFWIQDIMTTSSREV